MWTISTCSFGWRSNTPEPIMRAPLTVESKGRPTASLRRYCMSASCPIGAVAVAGRNRNRLGAALVDHLLDDRPTALFERVCVGHQLELAGIAIPYLQVFVVQNLKGVVRADSKHVARKPFHLAAIAGKAESNAALTPLGHGVVQIEKFAIAD